MANTRKEWKVIYRIGGRARCEWREVFTIYTSETDARTRAGRIERMGYKALVKNHHDLLATGLPEGWDSHSVDYSIVSS
jgi:hypothetical protein